MAPTVSAARTCLAALIAAGSLPSFTSAWSLAAVLRAWVGCSAGNFPRVIRRCCEPSLYWKIHVFEPLALSRKPRPLRSESKAIVSSFPAGSRSLEIALSVNFTEGSPWELGRLWEDFCGCLPRQRYTSRLTV